MTMADLSGPFIPASLVNGIMDEAGVDYRDVLSIEIRPGTVTLEVLRRNPQGHVCLNPPTADGHQTPATHTVTCEIREGL